ncbi:hypothetical protein PENTCL1PPCAC_15095, partial [Pristionchus entomophagus]
IGVLCNFLIVITTIKTSSLRTTCNVLIAICAGANIVHQLGGSLPRLPFLFDTPIEIDSELCILLIQPTYLFGNLEGSTVPCDMYHFRQNCETCSVT